MPFFTTINTLRFSLILLGLITLSACGNLEEVANQPPTASSVSITDDNGGIAVLGDSLTGSYSYADKEGNAEGETALQWLRDGVAIDDATTETYIVVLDDIGKGITFRVTPFAATGTALGVAVTSNVITVNNSAPTVSDVNITVDGGSSMALVGKTLIGNYIYGDVDGDLEGLTTFKWLRNNVEIVGATSQSYILVAEDSTTDITLEVTPVAATGTTLGTAVISNIIKVINSAPTASDVNVTIDVGVTPFVGGGLTGSYTFADVDNDAEGISTFRWLRGITPITDATTLNYVLTSADSGQDIHFEVTPVAQTGDATGIPVVSLGTVVGNTAPTAENVSINGTALVGNTLTGIYDFSDIDGDDEDVSIYRWFRGALVIPGATATTYALIAADSGKAIRFEVTPVAATGTGTGITVTSAEVIVLNTAPVVSDVNITVDGGGIASLGSGLTGSYIFADVDGDVDSSTFRWLRDGVAIAGATAQNYTLVTADIGPVITFEMVAKAGTGTSPGNTANATLTIANTAPVVSGINIAVDGGGIASLGIGLTGNYIFADVDGDVDSSTFRWLRGGVAIAGAIAQNYTLVTADIGPVITFEVVAKAATGTSPGNTATATLTVTNTAPVVNDVRITDESVGSVLVGDVLTGTYNYFDIDGDVDSSTFRWLRDGVVIAGATGSTYTLVTADIGPDITFEVTAKAGTGTTPGNIATATISVANTAPVVSAAAITVDGGAASLGSSLSGSYAYTDVDGDADSSTFRWLRAGTPITGATDTSYTLETADVGPVITFEVTAGAATGTTPGNIDSAMITVANSAPTASNVAISGTAQVGNTLSGNYLFNDVDGDLEGTSTFRWLRNGAPISGATATTYALVAADSGTTITFEVTPVAAIGTSPGNAVTSTGVAVTNTAPTANNVTISGTAQVGNTLTGSFDYADVDGDAPGTSTFRWLRNGAPISGATATTYALVAADSGTTITFEVTPVAAIGTSPGNAVTSTGVAVTNTAVTSTGVAVTAASSVTVVNNIPVANAGTDQTPLVGDTVTLDGSDSTDIDGDLLSYSWTLTDPADSTLVLTNATAVNPTFRVDLAGNYVAQLVVNDDTDNSTPDTVIISTTNSAPVANAGADQTITEPFSFVALNSSGSFDFDGDSLIYNWILTPPTNSTTAALSDPISASPTFTPDVLGTYVVQLTVTDNGTPALISDPDTVIISTNNIAPVANAGADQSMLLTSITLVLNGSASDVDFGDTFTYSWSVSSKPAASTLTTILVNLNNFNSNFEPDVPGTYVIQLIVNDGTVNSVPDTVTITVN